MKSPYTENRIIRKNYNITVRTQSYIKQLIDMLTWENSDFDYMLSNRPIYESDIIESAINRFYDYEYSRILKCAKEGDKEATEFCELMNKKYPEAYVFTELDTLEN